MSKSNNAADLSFLETEISQQKETGASETPGFDAPESRGLPLLTVVSHNADVLDPEHESYIDTAKPGDFFLKQIMEVYAPPLFCTPIGMKYCYAEFQPEMGPFVAYRSPEHAKALAVDHLKFGPWETKDGNVLMESFVFLLSLYPNGVEAQNQIGADQPILAMLNMISSRIPIAKAWIRNMQTRKLPSGSLALPHMTVYSLTTKRQKNEKGAWFGIAQNHEGFVNADQYQNVSFLRKEITESDILQIEDSTSERETGAGAGADGTDF